jgi:hypothetical protein
MSKSQVIVFDDELLTNKAGRFLQSLDWNYEQDPVGQNVLKTHPTNKYGDYLEYKELWRQFLTLVPHVRRRNQYVNVEKNGTMVPIVIYLQDSIARLDPAQDTDHIQRLQDFEAYQILMWKELESVIEKLCQNKYVRIRMHAKDDKDPLRDYRNSLYNHILE